MKQTTVPTANGPRRVRIIAKRGVWAVTPRLAPPGRLGTQRGFAVVTHLPTGLCIQHPEMTPADARRLMRELPLRTLADATFDRKQTAQPKSIGDASERGPAAAVAVAFFAMRGWR